MDLAGYDVSVCQVDLWGERGDAIVRRRKLAVFLRAMVAYPVLFWRFLRTPRPDIALIPYPGHFDVAPIALLCKLRRVPVVLDTFISLYDTIVMDRRLAKPGSLIGRIAHAADRIACRLPTVCLTDTPTHSSYFAADSGVPEDRFRVLWLGAREDIFRPQPAVEVDQRLVLFHGTFVRLQGLETIVRAAKLLESDRIKFRIVGNGQERELIEQLITQLGIRNVELPGLISLEEVPAEIASAAVCLGIFGTSSKASRVIPHKLYECLAVGRPVISGDTPALRVAFAEDEVLRVPVGRPLALADRIRFVIENPDVRERVAAAGHARFMADYGERALARLLRQHLEELVGDD
jgi:glycosyltransferase involved in cell wall biosynthesis